MRLFGLAFLALLACTGGAALGGETLRLGTTHTVEDSGLLKFLLPAFEAKTGIKVRVTMGGTGKVLKLGENGDVDVLLTHSPPDEEKFVAAGHGVDRRQVMHNDFVLVGPGSDPAGIRGMGDLAGALGRIHASRSAFVSRGDDSGTHKMERRLWQSAGLTPAGAWYLSVGQGMGEVLRIADARQAYALTDRATLAAHRRKLDLELLVAGKPPVENRYSVMAVNPKKQPGINHLGARAFIDWITSADGQGRIAQFRVNGEQLFLPAAGKP